MDHFIFLLQCSRFDPSHTRLCGCMAFVGLKNEILNTTSISVAVSAHKHTSHSCFKHTDTTFSLTDVIRGWWRGISTALQDKPCVLYWSRKERLAQSFLLDKASLFRYCGEKEEGKKEAGEHWHCFTEKHDLLRERTERGGRRWKKKQGQKRRD